MAHLSAAIYIHLPSSKHVTPLTHHHGDLPSWTWDEMESTSKAILMIGDCYAGIYPFPTALCHPNGISPWQSVDLQCCLPLTSWPVDAALVHPKWKSFILQGESVKHIFIIFMDSSAKQQLSPGHALTNPRNPQTTIPSIATPRSHAFMAALHVTPSGWRWRMQQWSRCNASCLRCATRSLQ